MENHFKIQGENSSLDQRKKRSGKLLPCCLPIAAKIVPFFSEDFEEKKRAMKISGIEGTNVLIINRRKGLQLSPLLFFFFFDALQ